MKVQCERCKEIVAFSFTVAEGGIDVACPSCGEKYFVPGTSPAPAPAPAPVPAPVSAPVPAIAIPPGPPGAAERFATCEERWDETAAHDDFIAFCSAEGSFAYAAARYRVAQADPRRAGAATQRLKQIRTLAEHALVAAVRSEKPLPRARTFKIIAGVVFALVLGLGVLLFVQLFKR